MVPLDHVIAFAAAALLIKLIPGPGVLFVIGRALAHGRSTALAGVVGNDVGTFAQAVGVALGIGALLERSALLFTVIKLIGAAYLVYLGVKAFRGRRTQVELGSAKARDQGGALRAARDGFIVGVTNPKNVIFFSSALPQFVDRSSGHVPLQMVAFGFFFAVIAVICDTAWSLISSSARSWFARSPRRLETVTGAGGVTMAGLGVALAASTTSK
ncbi:LysE family translocator [Streptomyces sp. HC44]|uniref:LysE family translocator n=1 Tax=Streptomyces scabichelini TaxID=2711217 RepID=A0A6G4VJ21_9ACTN|nr:LysE family translocator [Streptomyces scabichelini]NGO14152.1 LysE family translocator [Streptomyces scabichelini]